MNLNPGLSRARYNKQLLNNFVELEITVCYTTSGSAGLSPKGVVALPQKGDSGNEVAFFDKSYKMISNITEGVSNG